MSNQTVLIFGATGRTGSSIASAVLADKQFSVFAAVRPASATKESTKSLEANGARIRYIDIAKTSPDELVEVMKGVDTVISAVDFESVKLQYPMVDAVKRAGVKRFIPCDFGTACVKGTMKLHDEKLGLHDYIKAAGVPYTFIDVGWWMQLSLPYLSPETAPHPTFYEVLRTSFGSNNVKSAMTDLRDIGVFVSRIIADNRTINRYVFCWGEEMTRKEVFALAERVSGKKVDTVAATDAFFGKLAEGDQLEQALGEYARSIHVHGDNTVEKAKKVEYGEALDARKLYPDFQPRTLEAYAKEFYA